MKLFFIALFMITSSVALSQNRITSTIDKRVEMLSIIFRLAGNPEYNMKFAKNYISDIHAYFDPYKNHRVVSFAKELADKKNMGFSKVMFLAVHLQLVKNRFTLIKESESNLTGKWDPDDAAKFVELLNDFYKTSKFERFFNDHKQFYARATTGFDQSVAEFDQNWYLDYYGDHEVDYKVVIGLGDGGANYGPSVKPIGKKKLVYAIMGSWTFDDAGDALFAIDVYLPYLIHEFNHSFIDHLLDEPNLEAQLKPAGEILLNRQKNAMKLEGYEDWHSVINESLVRASVIRYMIDHKNPDEAREETAKQIKKGFLWTGDLVLLLNEYETSRSKYPTFKSFYPRIIDFFNGQVY
jgi:hypothetical protein